MKSKQKIKYMKMNINVGLISLPRAGTFLCNFITVIINDRSTGAVVCYLLNN